MGQQEALIAEDLAVYVRPPYVGHRGWVGIQLDKGLPLEVLKEHLDDALATVS